MARLLASRSKVDAQSVIITASTIRGNRAYGTYGGGLYVWNGAVMLLRGLLFEANEASRGASAVFADAAASSFIIDCSFRSHSALVDTVIVAAPLKVGARPPRPWNSRARLRPLTCGLTARLLLDPLTCGSTAILLLEVALPARFVHADLGRLPAKRPDRRLQHQRALLLRAPSPPQTRRNKTKTWHQRRCIIMPMA